jgi:signal recognition particle receptor subunit beta
MSFINYASREINCKIVYYGASLSGKTTNLQHIYDSIPQDTKGRLIALGNEMDRTLFVNFLPLDAGEIKGFKVRIHLYTVPGQVLYDSSWKLVLKGVDGIVFVADSHPDRLEANAASLAGLEENLKSQGYQLNAIPYVLQLNKRDIPNAVPIAEMTANLIRQTPPEPVFAAVASKGEGVFASLKEVTRRVLAQLGKAG